MYECDICNKKVGPFCKHYTLKIKDTFGDKKYRLYYDNVCHKCIIEIHKLIKERETMLSRTCPTCKFDDVHIKDKCVTCFQDLNNWETKERETKLSQTNEVNKK